ncbi:unnamed protein product [Pedinophyceae sp. YPF-701]|nr:unnamed protein product [Pedinophyceae sp. YPF-701]
MGYTRDLDRVGAEEGDPVALLPPLHFIFLGYSKLFAAKIAERGFELMGKTDVRFVEGLWKVMRDVFRYRPSITASQFLLKGYAERKAILVYDLAELCRKWHERLAR